MSNKENLMKKKTKVGKQKELPKSQLTLDKYFGFKVPSLSASSDESRMTPIDLQNNAGDDISESECFIIDDELVKPKRKLPETITRNCNESSATDILKRKSRFKSLEELEASYKSSEKKPNLAPIFLKQAPKEESFSIPPKQSKGITSNEVESILSDCYVTPLESLPDPPEYSGQRTPFEVSSVPFSHVVPGTMFVVDYFDQKNYSSVFLSHFHYDHYKGLTNSFTKPVYCSEDTARLVLQNFQKLGKSDKKIVCGLPVEKWSVVDGIPVLLLEAFHCPGAVCFVFRTGVNRFCFHSGDFRAGLFVERYAESLKKLGHLNSVFVDTTYCDPTYNFPPQPTIIKAVLDVCLSGLKPVVQDKRCLVVVGTYTIGKECVFASLGRLLNSPILVTSSKLRLIRCFLNNDNATLSYCNRLLSPCFLTTKSTQESRVHVIPLQKVNGKHLPGYLKENNELFDRLVAFAPTGWTNKACNKRNNDVLHKRVISSKITLYEVPYSEHSSFGELKDFVEKIVSRPASLHPSVFRNYEERREMEAQLKQWLH